MIAPPSPAREPFHWPYVYTTAYLSVVTLVVAVLIAFDL